MERVRVHIVIEGRVQGVNFRAATRDQARAGGVSGWVRNLPDGRVEALFEGQRDAVQHLVNWCHHGPMHARVDRVEVAWEQPEDLSGDFRIAR